MGPEDQRDEAPEQDGYERWLEEQDRNKLGKLMGWRTDKPKPAPTIRDAIRLIEKMEKCDGMPAKLILLRNFILFVAGRLSDWQ